MKTGVLIAAIFILIANSISSQVYLDPNPVLCAYNFFQCEKLYIEKIELTETATIVHYKYAVSSEWANIRKETCIFDFSNGKKYHLLKTEGLPIAPEKYYFKESQIFKFKLHFERIPDTLRQFDIIECWDDNCFNILDVSLDLSNEKANHISKYVNDNIPFKLWQFFYASINESSIDESFYQELMKDEKTFDIEDKYFDPDSINGDFYI